MRLIYFIFLLLISVHVVMAQDRWQEQTLVDKPELKLIVEFRLAQEPCIAGAQSEFRYCVVRVKTTRRFFVNWQLDYFTCNHELKAKILSLEVMPGMKTGRLIPRNPTFPGVMLAHHIPLVTAFEKTLPHIEKYEARSDFSLPPISIGGRVALNEGEQTTLTLNGGFLNPGDQWHWYEGGCGGKSIAAGRTLTVSPKRTTVYSVRAEGRGVTGCVDVQVAVTARPVKNATDAQEPISVALPVPANTPPLKRADVPPVPTTPPAVHANRYRPRDTYRTMINGGVSALDTKLDPIETYILTLAGGWDDFGWYVRAKYSPKRSKATFHTVGTYIADYQQAGYYVYNGNAMRTRDGYTGGIYLGTGAVALYLGGGYGERHVRYAIDQYSYSSGFLGTAWVEQEQATYRGAEAEIGLLLRVGPVNMMGGAAAINFKYVDYQLGIGLNF